MMNLNLEKVGEDSKRKIHTNKLLDDTTFN